VLLFIPHSHSLSFLIPSSLFFFFSQVSIKQVFPNYEGSGDAEDAMAYIRDQFVALKKNPKKDIYCHFTQATDTSNAQKVFDAVRSIVLELALRQANLD
jgi:hypothetical protein